MQSHSPSGAVLNPSQFMYNRSSHNSHCTMSSQDSGIEQRQNKLVSQVWLFWNLAVFGYRGKGSKTTSLQTLNIRQDASSNALTIRMFWIKSILWYALERKVSSIFTRTLRMVFSLSFVVLGGPNLRRGVQIRRDTGTTYRVIWSTTSYPAKSSITS